MVLTNVRQELAPIISYTWEVCTPLCNDSLHMYQHWLKSSLSLSLSLNCGRWFKKGIALGISRSIYSSGNIRFTTSHRTSKKQHLRSIRIVLKYPHPFHVDEWISFAVSVGKKVLPHSSAVHSTVWQTCSRALGPILETYGSRVGSRAKSANKIKSQEPYRATSQWGLCEISTAFLFSASMFAAS